MIVQNKFKGGDGMKKVLKLTVLFLAMVSIGQTVMAYVMAQGQGANAGNIPSIQRGGSPGA